MLTRILAGIKKLLRTNTSTINNCEAEKKLRNAEKTLNEPAFLSFDTRTHKVRSILLLLSITSIILVKAKLEVAEGSSFFGLILVDFPGELLKGLCLITILYFFIDFLFRAWENFLKWTIRLTGTSVNHKKLGDTKYESSDDVFSTTDTNLYQITLYSWWAWHKKQWIKCIEDRHSKVINKFNDIDEKLAGVTTALSKNNSTTEIESTQDLTQKLKELSQSFNSFPQSKDLIIQTLNDARIFASLRCFDNRFNDFRKIQNIRWFAIDLLPPFLLGSYAIYLLSPYSIVIKNLFM